MMEGKEINSVADLSNAIAQADKAANVDASPQTEEEVDEEEPIFALNIRPRFIMMHCIGSVVSIIAGVIITIMVIYEGVLATNLGAIGNIVDCPVDQVRIMLYTSMIFKALIVGTTIYVILEGFFSICLPLIQPFLSVISGIFLISMPVFAVVSATCFFVIHGLAFGPGCRSSGTTFYANMVAYVVVNWIVFLLGCMIMTLGHCLSACVMGWGVSTWAVVRKRLGIRINLGQEEDDMPNIAQDGSD